MIIHGLKLTPGPCRWHASPTVPPPTADPLRPRPSTPDCRLHGQGVGKGRPHERFDMPPGVVRAEGTNVEPRYVGICRDRWVHNAEDPDCGRQWVQRRGIYVRELSRLPLVILRETLPERVAKHSLAERGPPPPGRASPRVGALSEPRPARTCPAPQDWSSSGGEPAAESPPWGLLCCPPRRLPQP